MSNNTKSNIYFTRVQLDYLKNTYLGIINTKVTPKLTEREIMYNAGILEVISKVAEQTPENRQRPVLITEG
jgi:hypothetical protein